MPRAVHRLEAEALPLDLDRPEHPVGEVLEMPRDLVELLVHDVRRDDRLVAALAQALADELLDDAADERALGMPEDEPAAGVLLDRVEVELAPELAMVALAPLLRGTAGTRRAPLRRERGAVDALQHRVVLVAAPVGAGDAHQLDRPDLAGRVRVTAAAQIGELADRVERDRLALGDLARDLDLVRVVAEALDRAVARDAPAGHLVVGRDDLAHPRLEPSRSSGVNGSPRSKS